MLFLISDERTVERTENSMFPYLKEHPQDESGQAPARTHSAVVLYLHMSCCPTLDSRFSLVLERKTLLALGACT